MSFMMSHGTCAWAIKQLSAASGGDTLVQLLLGGTRTCMNRCTGAPRLREPTSFKHSWLGCFSSSACVRIRRRTHYTLRTAQERRVLPKEYRLHRTIVPFGALSKELLFTSPETVPMRRPTSFLCGACHIYMYIVLRKILNTLEIHWPWSISLIGYSMVHCFHWGISWILILFGPVNHSIF